VLDVTGGNHELWNGKASDTEPVCGQVTSSAGNDGPAARRQRGKQTDGSREDGDVIGVCDLTTLQIPELGFGIEMGREQPNRVDGAASVGGMGGFVRI
jgi:hypothetical protein